jgi:hypothetical protein
MESNRLTTACTFQFHISSESALATLPPAKANALRTDLGTVDERIRSGVTHQRAKAMDNHWSRWDAFCLEHNIDPYLRNWADPVPIIQVFGERYRDGRLAPLKNAVKARTVEDALRAIGQAHARLGAPDPRKDSHGGIDFRIQRQISSYKKVDRPPRRVKPIPIIIILYILAQAYDDRRSESDLAVADMIVIAFFFLLRPGEYTGTTNDDAPFRLEDVHLYIGARKLDSNTASLAEFDAASSVSYRFTSQKNGIRDEKLVQGRSGSGLCCPVKATVRRIKHHRLHKSKPNAPLASYYRTNRRTAIKPKDVTDVLRQAMTANFHRTGVHASEVSARSLRAGGAMAMLFGKIDINSIRMMGRWHSDAMMRYLHVQAQPIIGNYAAKMFQEGTYTFQPDETVPIIDVYDD